MSNDNVHAGKQKKIFVVIHGHFYQPPRENPWTQTVLIQESARPFHDWNERIATECYSPNTRSRVLGAYGRISTLVNNFAHINFNIGPTLFSWIEKYQPETYHRILQADLESRKRNDGHGNAIAQVYNHIILPLANKRDMLTQIRWGIREFQHRYGRSPESIWLSETAINQKTVECLVNERIKYVILSPTQAQRVRKIGEKKWHDVSHNSIDTTQPYRIFLRPKKKRYGLRRQKSAIVQFSHAMFRSKPQSMFGTEILSENKFRWLRRKADLRMKLKRQHIRRHKKHFRSIDVFFYDGQLSVEISFQHLLRNSQNFVRRLHESAANSSTSSVLVNVSTDGEIYGHHEPFADMCLSSALTTTFPEFDVEVTNYGRYLNEHPPTMEVELKTGGENGEGTAWSCAHGVGRWYRDCGCSIGHVPGWNQQWRTPLRKGFDVLRDTLAGIFERSLNKLLCNPWEARDDYIECILSSSKKTVEDFFYKHQKRPLDEEERSRVLRLMEAQKFSMLTYTSCAWFFDDVSGLEVIQNMRYAARVIQLIEGIDGDYPGRRSQFSDIETLMLSEFDQAQSNIPECGTGKDVYIRYVKPDIYTPERAVNQFLLSDLIHRVFCSSSPEESLCVQGDEERRVYIYALRYTEGVIHKNPLIPLDEQGFANEKSSLFANIADKARQRLIYSGVLDICDVTTRQKWSVLFSTFMKRPDQPVSYLKRVADGRQWTQFKAFMEQWMSAENDAQQHSLQQLEHAFEIQGFHQYGLTDVYEEDRKRLFSLMVQRGVKRLERHLQAIYEDSREFLAQLTALHVSLPSELRTPVEFALSYKLYKETEKLSPAHQELHDSTHLGVELEELLQLSHTHHIELDKTLLQARLSGTLRAYVVTLSRYVRSWIHDNTLHKKEQKHVRFWLKKTLSLLEHTEKLGITLDMTEAQNLIFEIFHEILLPYFSKSCITQEKTTGTTKHGQESTVLREYLLLLERLNFHIDGYQGMLFS